jgi:S-DNA-T family DNA segregation ATPase FtsK/SpoIIIE
MKPLTLIVTPTRNRRLNELVGLLLLLASSLLLLALASYHPSDRSFDTVTGIPGAAPTGHVVKNWTGPAGALLSDLLLQIEGVTAFALPLFLALLGWAWFRSQARAQTAGNPWVKVAGIGLLLVSVPVLLALLPWDVLLFGAIHPGGIVGILLRDWLVHLLNVPGTCVLAVFTAGVGLYLMNLFTFSSLRMFLLVRLAFAARLRDRRNNWREARAQRKLDRQNAKLLADAAEADDTGSAEDDSADEDALAAELYASEQAAARFLEPEFELSGAPPARREVRAERPTFLEEDGPVPSRRGAFAEMQEARRPIASAWDDESFAAAIDREDALAETPEAVAEVQELPRAPMRPQLVPTGNIAPPPSTQPAAGGPVFAARADAGHRPVTMTAKSVTGFASAYKLPPTTLLHRSEGSHEVRQEELRLEAQVLVEKCAEFDVGGSVTQINPGPVVTTFEFRPEAGVKYSRVTGLAEDLCLAMAAESILIERMAGKSTVGIQVPNSERETIWLRDIIEAEGFAHSKSKITMAMGKDINGRIVVADLATMPHVLIAGSTGSGKSVAINAMIMSVLFKATPEQVRLILVDPKRVELGMYEGIPHLFTPIITEPKLAANALKNAVREMERRLKLLASRSVRNIDQYNRLFDEQPSLWDEQGVEETPLPYIMIIIDELADLMILDKSNVEEAITRLAQMARAVGIHLVLATQRPSVDVITGLIKANVPTRMSFRLSTKVDSRTILDANGAESLLGRGDMLFLPPGTSRLQRVHAPFVTEKEIAAVTSFWKAQGEVTYAEGFLDAPKDANGREIDGDGSDSDSANDELFDDAVRLVFEFGKASTSLLQRRMRIGYGRAAALIDMMERDGLVGPPEGSKPRELLKPASWLRESDEALR